MDYQAIYHHIIERAKHRIPDAQEYYEKHHILPRCLGGSDKKSNLVKLTAREHYIAHLCLVKMHPSNGALVKAAMMMCTNSPTHCRSRNRIYEWLRKKHSLAMKESQTGSRNSQYGTVWVFCPSSKEEKKILKEEVENYITSGWVLGRNHRLFACSVCLGFFKNHFQKKTCSEECFMKSLEKHKLFKGREKEFLDYYQLYKSMNRALKAMGFKGAVSHYYQWAKLVIDKKEIYS